MTTPPSTERLLARARAGDDDAFTDLHARLAPRVRGLVALRMGRTLADFVAVEDLVQETLADAFLGLDRFPEPGAEGDLVCWLARLAERRVRDAWRARGAHKRGKGRVSRFADLRTTEQRGAEPGGRDPSPSRALRDAEAGARLEAALLRLSERYRVVVYCRLVLEMEFAAIAAGMGLKNAATACALFHKAAARLAQRLGPPTV